MPHYEISRSLTIDPQQAHQILVEEMQSIRAIELKDPSNPIVFTRKRRFATNRHGLNGQAVFNGAELRISIDGEGSDHQKIAYAIIDLLPQNSYDDYGIIEAMEKMEKIPWLFPEARNLIDEMRSGERLRFLTSGQVDNLPVAVLLTDQRVFLKSKGHVGALSSQEIDPRSITSIETGRKFTGDTVKLTVSGAKIELDFMPEGRASEFADQVRTLKEELNSPARHWSAEQPPQESGDNLDQLSKLAELHAAGVLTDEEFTAAKAKALGL
ncbi:PH domain-containing protein [Corynebacterium stationis]|uniref:PH domain-containing protein n=1 Tax=Corynebacterium stationis TaxID=1705 RepID=UPI0026030351|nr:PH domain-containing protein [Corynebacterium stationis]